MLKNDYRVYEESVRREMLPFVPENAKTILDVGCSVGNFGEMLKVERGAEVWGIEPDQEAAFLAARRLDNVLCGHFDPNLDLANKRFDCIVFNDVLEHMVDPYSALEYAKSLLVPKGVVVASIPNVRYFMNVWNLLVYRAWDYVDTGILDRTHLRFFTRDSIVRTFVKHGFRIQSITGINSLAMCNPSMRLKFSVLNLVTLNRSSDMKWMQFAVVATPEGGE